MSDAHENRPAERGRAAYGAGEGSGGADGNPEPGRTEAPGRGGVGDSAGGGDSDGDGEGANGAYGEGARSRERDPARTWALLAPATAALVAAYFLLPAGSLGPRRPILSWALFLAALVLIAVLLLRHIRDALLNRPHTRPAAALVLLMCLTVLVFATAYLSLSRHPGEFHGLHTHLDALYFTFVTLATVGYGDITPHGQSARLATLLQIAYTLVFLTAGATAVTQHLKRHTGHATHPHRPHR